MWKLSVALARACWKMGKAVARTFAAIAATMWCLLLLPLDILWAVLFFLFTIFPSLYRILKSLVNDNKKAFKEEAVIFYFPLVPFLALILNIIRVIEWFISYERLEECPFRSPNLFDELTDF